MVKTIEITDELYARLGSMAQGFDDTAANVIERLVKNETRTDMPPRSLGTYEPSPTYSGKDTTKYIFNGQRYGKGRLSLAVVTEYVRANPNVTFDELKEVFPDRIQGGLDVFAEIEDAKHRTQKTKRYYFGTRHGALEPLKIADCTIVVSNQWGIGNIHNMLEKAEELGFNITSV